MKQFYLGILFSLGISIAANAQASAQFSQTIKMGKIELMSEDVGVMSWELAKERAEKLGSGWRLPTIEELKLIFKRKDRLGNFMKNSYYVNYLSSSVVAINDKGEDKFLVLNFNTGKVEKGALSLEMYNVRLVRDR